MPRISNRLLSADAVSMHHDDASGCSYGGRQFRADQNGNVLVPPEAASELLAHGFLPVLVEASRAVARDKSITGTRSNKG